MPCSTSIGSQQRVNTLDAGLGASVGKSSAAVVGAEGILQIHDMSRVTNNLPSGVFDFRYSLLSK
jgi:hypothetical protein